MERKADEVVTSEYAAIRPQSTSANQFSNFLDAARNNFRLRRHPPPNRRHGQTDDEVRSETSMSC